MQTLTNLMNIIVLMQQNAAKIGILLAGLFVSVYCIGIMFNNDNSPSARTERWIQLRKVFLCAAVIAATGAFIQFATDLGKML